MGWKMNTRAFAFLLLIAATEVNAAEWYRLSMSANGDQIIYIDASSLTISPQGTRQAWLNSIKKDKSSVKYLESVKCKTRESASISGVAYTSNGDSEGRFHDKTPEYSPVIPDSQGEGVLEAICSQSIRQYALKRGGYQSVSPTISAASEFNNPAPSADEAPEVELPPAWDDAGNILQEAEPAVIAPVGCYGQCERGYKWAADNKPSSKYGCYTVPESSMGTGCIKWLEERQ